MRVTGKRTINGVAAPMLYGPAGLELWARHKDGTVVQVLAIPWTRIVDIVGTDVPNWRGVEQRGIRITLTDGGREDLVVSPTNRAWIKAARAAGTSWNVVAASKILAKRSANAAWPNGESHPPRSTVSGNDTG
jgi:hypothetical protein